MRLPLSRSRLAVAFVAMAPALSLALDLDEPSRTDLQITVERTLGRYGDADNTRIINVPVVLRHRSGRFTGQIEVPFIRIDSTERVLPGFGAIGNAARSERVTESGLGDVWLKATFELIEFSADSPGIDTTLKVKTKTGNVDRGLGTGGTDAALQVEWFKGVAGVTAFGHVGYRKTGDVPGFVPYKDPWYGELGLFAKYLSTCQFGGYYDYRQPIGRLGPLSEITLYTACTEGPQRTQLYVTRGFKPASPDFGLGITYRYRF